MKVIKHEDKYGWITIIQIYNDREVVLRQWNKESKQPKRYIFLNEDNVKLLEKSLKVKR